MSCCPASEMNSCVELLHIVLRVTSAIQKHHVVHCRGREGAHIAICCGDRIV
jgi:hypothetical protein